ncbi:MAG TPA: response regulator [Longimicrobiales bacterium]
MQGPPDLLCVLIAERDQSVRRLQKLFLERAGFAVEFSDDGQDTLERALLTPPSLVIAEILIPRIDGLALCRRLRGDPRTGHVPVLIFSILAAAQRAAEAGATAFLRKPLVDSLFVAAVQDLTAAQPTTAVEMQWASKS